MQVNVKKNLLVVNPILESVDSKDIILSIRLSMDGFCFSVVNKPSSELLLLADYAVDFGDSFDENLNIIRPVFEEHKLTTRFFPNKKIILKNKRFGLLPSSLFDKDSIVSCLEILHGNPQVKMSEFSDHIESFQIKNIYDYPVALSKVTRLIFPSAEYMHYTSAFLLYACRYVSENQTVVVVDVDHQDLCISIFDNKNLLFCNIFEYQTQEDFIYFILATLTQLGIDKETIQLLLTGKIEKDSQLFFTCYKYIKDVKLIEDVVCQTTSGIDVNHYASLLYFGRNA